MAEGSGGWVLPLARFASPSATWYPAVQSVWLSVFACAMQVRVCAFPGSSFGLSNVAISPDLDPSFDIPMRQVSCLAREVAAHCLPRVPHAWQN